MVVTVKINNSDEIISAESLTVEIVEPSWRLKFLNAVIASPEVAMMLLLAGIAGLTMEGWNPGAIIPGVAGAIFLLARVLCTAGDACKLRGPRLDSCWPGLNNRGGIRAQLWRARTGRNQLP